MSNEADIFFAKKSYELCYALFRVASHVKRQSFADSLERHGLALMEAAYGKDYARAGIETGTIDCLIKLGSDLGLVGLTNAEVMSRELCGFNSAIAELKSNSATVQNVNLEDIFSNQEMGKNNNAEQNNFQAGKTDNRGHDGTSGNESDNTQNNSSPSTNGDNGFMRVDKISNGVAKSFARKSTVFDRIRQNGNCRLREIQEILPDVSERTLRYDVQNLVEHGFIERVGNGGPATYYRAIAESIP